LSEYSKHWVLAPTARPNPFSEGAPDPKTVAGDTINDIDIFLSGAIKKGG